MILRRKISVLQLFLHFGLIVDVYVAKFDFDFCELLSKHLFELLRLLFVELL